MASSRSVSLDKSLSVKMSSAASALIVRLFSPRGRNSDLFTLINVGLVAVEWLRQFVAIMDQHFVAGRA